MRNLIVVGAIFGLMASSFADLAVAENPEGPDYQVGGSNIDLHRRYPGDRPLDSGNVRSRGPERGAYVERCTWVARDGIFGFPWGFSQQCQRHTLDNTQ